MAFLETIGPMLFEGLQWDDTVASNRTKALFETQWTHLRTACLFFMRNEEGQHTVERITQAAEHALLYAESAQKVRDRATALAYCHNAL